MLHSLKEASDVPIYVNGVRADASILLTKSSMTLATFLREHMRLTGTKIGCGEGGCGACTVMISDIVPGTQRVRHRAVNACLLPALSCVGAHVTTVEGLGSVHGEMHPVQKRVAELQGSQCGFCSPGFVMSLYAFLRNHPAPSVAQLEACLDGNLCRCTGHRPLLDAAKSFASRDSKQEFQCAMGDRCCRNSPNVTDSAHKLEHSTMEQTPVPTVEQLPRETATSDTALRILSQPGYAELAPRELIFPPALAVYNEEMTHGCVGIDGDVLWRRPLTLEALCRVKREFPEAAIVGGNTEIGVDIRVKKKSFPVRVDMSRVAELRSLGVDGDVLRIGGGVTIAELREYCAVHEEYSVQYAIRRQCEWFASRQVRSVATVAGNLCTASPISDLNVVWLAHNATIVAVSVDGERRVAADDFFTGYRQVALQAHEVVKCIEITLDPQRRSFAFKKSKRREDDIATLTACVAVQYDAAGETVVDTRIAAGGVAAKCTRAPASEAALTAALNGRVAFLHVQEEALKEFPLTEQTPGGTGSYRAVLFVSFLLKVVERFTRELDSVHAVSTATHTYQVPVSQLSQKETDILDTISVGKPVTHRAAYQQCTGEAGYVDDAEVLSDEVHVALVIARKACAKLESIEAPEHVRNDPAFVRLLTGADVGQHTLELGGSHDESLVVQVGEYTPFVGATLGYVVAKTHDDAWNLAEQIRVSYSDEKQPILNVVDAVKRESFHSEVFTLVSRGVDVDEVLATCDPERFLVFQGEVMMGTAGGQEHFYLETQSTRVERSRESRNEWRVTSSTQNCSEIQLNLAHVLGIPAHGIVVRTKRLGGGFGGKETRGVPYACAAALAAFHCRASAARCVLPRDVDMVTSGTRHPFVARYRAAFDRRTNKCVGLKIEAFLDGGHSADLSVAVLMRTLWAAHNAYDLPALHIDGRVCKTNLPSNTAFRGFGAPQGMFIAECVMRRAAQLLDVAALVVVEANLLRDRAPNVLHYDQAVERCTVQRCVEEIKTRSEFERRRDEIDAFNRNEKFVKRGLALVPTCYGIAFGLRFLNQAGALVHIYLDGSVLVSHGGVEMGQGLHTKLTQIAATELEVPIDNVLITETATDKVPNASATAASASSDLYGAATLRACRKLQQRLAPFRKEVRAERPNATPLEAFRAAVSKAYMSCTNLSAQAFYYTPDLDFDWSQQETLPSGKTRSRGTGRVFNYYTNGAAVVEVELDVLTGDWRCVRADLLMDLGRSLNPTIDIGQIEGAFAQGLGLFALEQHVVGQNDHWLPPGFMLTRGPGAYKLPSTNDVPVHTNVHLLRDSDNPRAVHGSKAVGEPPLFLGSAVYFALMDAVAATQPETPAMLPHESPEAEAPLGVSNMLGLPVVGRAPCSGDRLRLACHDEQQLAQHVLQGRQ